MLTFNTEQLQKLSSALLKQIISEVTFQIILGFAAFAAVFAAIGWFLGSVFYGAVVGLAIHAALIVISSEFIDGYVDEMVESRLSTFRHNIINAPKLIQKKYVKNLADFDDEQMRKWAAKNFAVRITPIDLIDSL